MSNPTPIAKLIEAFAKIHNKQHLFDEVQAVQIWKTLVSPEILAHTLKAEMQNGILFIKTDSSALKHNLRFQVDEFREKINAHFAREVVQTIAIL